MSSWITSLLLAVFVVAAPFTFVLKVLLGLPRPLAASHRRWPRLLNSGLIALLTTAVTIFIRRAYYSVGQAPAETAAEFLIAALAYVFGLVLLLRQFSGVYPEFIVTTGWTGLHLRKTTYRNIERIETVSEKGGETELEIRTARGDFLRLTLPTGSVAIFYDQVRKKNEIQTS